MSKQVSTKDCANRRCLLCMLHRIGSSGANIWTFPEPMKLICDERQSAQLGITFSHFSLHRFPELAAFLCWCKKIFKRSSKSNSGRQLEDQTKCNCTIVGSTWHVGRLGEVENTQEIVEFFIRWSDDGSLHHWGCGQWWTRCGSERMLISDYGGLVADFIGRFFRRLRDGVTLCLGNRK